MRVATIRGRLLSYTAQWWCRRSWCFLWFWRVASPNYQAQLYIGPTLPKQSCNMLNIESAYVCVHAPMHASATPINWPCPSLFLHTVSAQYTLWLKWGFMVECPWALARDTTVLQETSIPGIVCILLERKPPPLIIFYQSAIALW